MTPDCYIVLMRRWGDIEAHTYVHGIYTDEQEAIRQGKEERGYRGIKYEYQVMAWQMDSDLGQQVATTCPGPYAHKQTDRLLKRAQKLDRK